MTELETYAIRELIECYGTGTNAQVLANKQLQTLLDENYRKEAQIVELERRITDIHRHYAKRLGD